MSTQRDPRRDPRPGDVVPTDSEEMLVTKRGTNPEVVFATRKGGETQFYCSLSRWQFYTRNAIVLHTAE